MDIDLLLLLSSKEKWERFSPYVKDWTLSKECAVVYNSMAAYYKTFPSLSAVNWDAFESFFFVYKAAQITATNGPLYKALFKNIKEGTPSTSQEDVIKHFVTQECVQLIGEKIEEVKHGKATIDDISELIQKYDKELGRAINPTDLFVTTGVSSILSAINEPGLSWRLNELNISCGPLRKGDFVLVAAYVETGKTTFAASEVSWMAQQIPDERPVVWINNEERSEKVLLRIQQAALGCTLNDYKLDEAGHASRYDALMKMPNRILVMNNNAGMNNAHKLTPVLRDLNPALIVFDQLDKVDGFSRTDGEEHSRLGRLYKWARDLSHEYGPVIAISQTDFSSATDKYIHMSQLRGSKVDKPGEADAIITIGKTEEPGMQDKRFIHVPKNKLTGGPLSDEKERHGYWEVSIKPSIARYEGVK